LSLICFNVSGNIKEYVTETNNKLSEKSFIRNPFTGYCVQIGDTIYLKMKPFYPDISILTIVSCVIVYFISGFTYNMLWSLIFTIPSLFRNKYFFYYMFRLGLRKKGFKVKTKIVNKNNAIDNILVANGSI
jgi:hypothetical protein